MGIPFEHKDPLYIYSKMVTYENVTLETLA